MIHGGGSRTFNKSGIKSLTIPLGSATHTPTLDLGKNYAFVVMAVRDCAGIQSATNLGLQIAMEVPSTQLYDVYEPNDPTTKWSKVMPTAGSLFMRVDGLDFARYLKLTLSKVTTAAVLIDIWGFDGVL